MISVILPAFNEAENLKLLLRRLNRVFNCLQLRSFEIIVVDDCSTDGTEALMQRKVAADRRVQHRRLAVNAGHQAAIAEGLILARGAAAIVMDADLQHPPEYLTEMIRHWRNGKKIVTMRRSNSSKASKARQILTRIYYRVARKWTPYCRPGSADFYLLDQQILKLHRQLRDFHEFHRGLVAWYPVARVELPFVQAERAHGRAKYSIISSTILSLRALNVYAQLANLQWQDLEENRLLR